MSEPEKVVGIHGGPVRQHGEVQDTLVSVLEDALERAKTGQLQSIIGTGFTSDGARYCIRAGIQEDDIYSMLGAIAWLEHEYVARITGKIA